MNETMYEHEDFLELEDEFEDFLELEDELEDELHEHEAMELEDELFEHEAMELEHEDFLGGLLSSVLGGEITGPLSEHEETELATELLEVSSEQELEQFLGKLIRGATKAVGGFVRSPAGRALGGMLKNVAKKALPVVGGALGSMVAPGVGTAIGSKLGSLASGLFETETGELNPQELEFEMARRVVRIGAGAARQAAAQSRRGATPARAASTALVGSTRRYAPAALPRRLGGAPMPVGRFRTRRPAGVPYRAMPSRPSTPRRRYGGTPGMQSGWPRYDGASGMQSGWPRYDGARPVQRRPARRRGTRPWGAGWTPSGAWEPQPWSSSAAGGRWVRRGSDIVVMDA